MLKTQWTYADGETTHFDYHMPELHDLYRSLVPIVTFYGRAVEFDDDVLPPRIIVRMLDTGTVRTTITELIEEED